MPTANSYGRALAATKTIKPATRPSRTGGKPTATGRALALTRGKGKKIGLKRTPAMTPTVGAKPIPDFSNLQDIPYAPPQADGGFKPMPKFSTINQASGFASGVGTRKR